MELLLNYSFVPVALAAAAHLSCCAAGKQSLRHITKLLLLPLLALGCLFSGGKPGILVYLGLLLGWIGDIFLIWPGNEARRSVGIAAFTAGHGLYIAAILLRLGALPLPRLVWLPPLGFLLLAALLYVRLLLPVLPAKMRVPGGAYFLVLAVVGALSGLLLLGGAQGGPCLLAGALLFLASDTVLCRQFYTVGDPAPRYDFSVMLTYILAQTLLLLGFAA